MRDVANGARVEGTISGNVRGGMGSSFAIVCVGKALLRGNDCLRETLDEYRRLELNTLNIRKFHGHVLGPLPSEITAAEIRTCPMSCLCRLPITKHWSCRAEYIDKQYRGHSIVFIPTSKAHNVRQRHLLHPQTLQQDRPHHRRLGRHRCSHRHPVCSCGSQRDHLGTTKGSVGKGCRGGEEGEQGGTDGAGGKGV